jgi:hypothetical protein
MAQFLLSPGALLHNLTAYWLNNTKSHRVVDHLASEKSVKPLAFERAFRSCT